jgi:proteasome lid subunit RPN8/RPN11
VPFEEDSRNAKIWFVDHNFHEKMFAMFRKVNASERVVGWYSSGPRIRPNDIDINELFRRYCRDPVLVVVEIKSSSDTGLPTKAYVSVEKVSAEDGTSSMQFEHIESSIGAVEAEEVGVEHLLRDVHDSSVSSLTADVRNKVKKGRNVGVLFLRIFRCRLCDRWRASCRRWSITSTWSSRCRSLKCSVFFFCSFFFFGKNVGRDACEQAVVGRVAASV